MGTRSDLDWPRAPRYLYGIDNYYCDRQRRHRFIHDEWFVSVLELGVPMTRGLSRRKGARVAWSDSRPEDVWQLARRFRDYKQLFSHATYDVQQRKKGMVCRPRDD
jgi:hypothetical protein